MRWFKDLFKDKRFIAKTPEDVIRYYQQLGFFANADPEAVIEEYAEEYDNLPDPSNPWDDVFLLAFDKDYTWAGDPEADVCSKNKVYADIFSRWAAISHGAFAPVEISEKWESNTGPITLRFYLSGKLTILSPEYQNDWINLEVLSQINKMIESSGRQFECALDGNFALVMCLTPKQKILMETQRQFPFAW